MLLSLYFLVSQLLQKWGEEDFLAYVDRYCILGSILYIEMDVTQLFYFELFQNDVKNTRYKVYYLTHQICSIPSSSFNIFIKIQNRFL